jgi:hypothetical protein
MASDADQSPPVQSHSPPGLVFAAVAVGGLGIGFGIAATVLMLDSQQPAPAPSASVSAPLPAPEPAPVTGPWTEQLHAEACPAPCCGGSACRVSADNAGKKSCPDGDSHCQACVSKVSCIPGACGEVFKGDEQVSLHLSSVLERGESGIAQDACKTGRDLWVCLRHTGDRQYKCLSQREACSNGSRSPAGFELRVSELMRPGLLIEVREGGPEGKRLAQRREPLYQTALKRSGLCGGFRGDFDPGPVSAFTFFLDVPEAGAPEPVRAGAALEEPASPEAAPPRAAPAPEPPPPAPEPEVE